MTGKNLYSLTQVEPCEMAPQNVEMNDVKLTMYTQHFRNEINATISDISAKETDFIAGWMIEPVWIWNNHR